MKHETYILSDKLCNAANIHTKPLQVNDYNIYIIGGLRIILGDTEIELMFFFFQGNCRHIR